mgnify:CR=1 FL=1
MKRVLLTSVILVALLLSACAAPATTPEPAPAPAGFTLSTSVSPIGAGSVSPSSGDYQQGDPISIRATPSAGYTFAHWSGDVGTIADVNAASTTITMDSDYSIIANFEVIPPVQYGLTISSTAGGQVTTPGEGMYTYAAGTVVKILATADAGYTFTHWSSDASGTSTTVTVTMNSDKTLVAHFTEIPPATLTLLDLNTPYTAQSGLTVTVTSITKTQRDGFKEYSITYTLKNETTDQAIDEGTFKMFWVGGGGELQYGFFGRLFPGESKTRSYTWKVLDTQQVLYIEFEADFFAQQPADDTLKWGIPSD